MKLFLKTVRGLELVSFLIFCMIFKVEYFSLYSINWPSIIVSLLLLLEMLGNMWIVFVCFPCCDVINIEIILSFLIKPFSHRAKKSGQKLKYFNNEKSFQNEISVFHHFQRAFIEANKTNFFGSWEPYFNIFLDYCFFLCYLHKVYQIFAILSSDLDLQIPILQILYFP